MAPLLSRRQVHRLSKRSIPRRIPNREPDPLLAINIKRNVELVRSHRRHLRKRNGLTVGTLPIPPNQLRELGRESPLHIGVVEPPRSRTLNPPIPEQYLTTGDEVVPVAQ